MKISTKTMAAIEKAAAEQRMSVDAWLEKVIAQAPGQSRDVTAMLLNISKKVDQIADRQSLGEKATEQLAATVDEIGESFKQVRKTTGRVFERVRSRTGTAVSGIAEKAKDVFGQVSQSAADLAGNIAPKSDVAELAAPQPAKPQRRRSSGKTQNRRSPDKPARVSRAAATRRPSSPRKKA